MIPERFRQIRNLFEAVVERPPETRGAFLAEACAGDADLQAEVERLLAAHRRDTDLLAGPAVPPANLLRLEGRHVGPYEILREIGHGGMGIVYLAVRADGAFRKQVALKVVRPEAGGEEVLRRFQREREILANLDHPNIARLLDGGSTEDGLRYFVMEYVNGEPIDIYCDRHKLKVADRLELFRTVCAAVEYAHRNGIAHRDLKPGNILVTSEGTAKLLDFGIAKLLRAAEDETVYITRTGLHLMTPEYASPEQIRGEAITALSDVYSLGVILYELLTGHRPYRMRSRLFHEIVRVICEEPPTKPSTAVGLTEEQPGMRDSEPVTVTPEMVSRARDASPAELRRQLTGDLDNVLLKSLSKEPLARYRSAEQMSEDIRHHLQGEPVLATSETLFYRIGKFLQRYRIWVIAAAALAAAIGTGVVTIRPVGLLYFGGAMLTFGLWYAVTDRVIGRRIADWSTLIGFGLAIAFLIAYLSLAWRLFPRAWYGPLGYGLFAIIYCPQAIGWLTRERRAGRLLLDLSQPRNKILGFLKALCMILFLLAAYLGPTSSSILWFLTAVAWSGSEMILDGRLEIREKGIVSKGKLLRWGNIESYEWISEVVGWVKPSPVVLKVHVRRLLKALPPTKIPIPPERREEVNAMLSRYLSDWPTAQEPALSTPAPEAEESPAGLSQFTPDDLLKGEEEPEAGESPAGLSQSQLRDSAAIEYYERSLTIACGLNDPQAISAALADLGVARAQSGEHDQAIALFMRSLALQPKEIAKAKALWNMSLSLDELGQRESAIARAEEALQTLAGSKSPETGMVQQQLEKWRKDSGS
jgi:serine/threonine protein kinase